MTLGTKTIKCVHCREERPAICFGCYEDCDNPIKFACDECCGHGNEDGWCSPLEDLAGHMTTQRDDLRTLDDTNTFLLGEIADAEKDTRESRESEIEAITEKEEMQHARDCQYDDMVLYRDQLEAKTAQVVELEQMCKVANEHGDAALSDYNRELLRVEAWRKTAEAAGPNPGAFKELITKARALDSATEAGS